MYSRGLVLSGGAARGFAHPGVILALEEAGYHFDVIAGVSIGAVVGALYADGKSAIEIFEIFEKEQLFNLMKFKLRSVGLFRSDGLRNVLKRNLSAKNFEDLKTPLRIAATNYQTGKLCVFDKGELIEPIMASAAIPVLFHAIPIENELYIDGGILSNLPVELLQNVCENVVAVNVNPLSTAVPPVNLMDVLLRTLQLGVSANIQHHKSECALFIEPTGLDKFGMFSLKNGAEMFQLAYTYTQQFLNVGK